MLVIGYGNPLRGDDAAPGVATGVGRVVPAPLGHQGPVHEVVARVAPAVVTIHANKRVRQPQQVAGDQDGLVRDTDAKRIYYESTRIPEANKDFILLVSDSHGTPPLLASHRAPTAMDKDYDSGESLGGGPVA